MKYSVYQISELFWTLLPKNEHENTSTQQNVTLVRTIYTYAFCPRTVRILPQHCSHFAPQISSLIILFKSSFRNFQVLVRKTNEICYSIKCENIRELIVDLENNNVFVFQSFPFFSGTAGKFWFHVLFFLFLDGNRPKFHNMK